MSVALISNEKNKCEWNKQYDGRSVFKCILNTLCLVYVHRLFFLFFLGEKMLLFARSPSNEQKKKAHTSNDFTQHLKWTSENCKDWIAHLTECPKNKLIDQMCEWMCARARARSRIKIEMERKRRKKKQHVELAQRLQGHL